MKILELLNRMAKALEALVSAAQTNASETVKGLVEEATQAQVNAGTDTGETGAKLFIPPSKLGGGVGAAIANGASAAINDTDKVATVEGNTLKVNTWTTIKAFLKTYFDTIYASVTRTEFIGVAMSDETTVLSAASTSIPLATIHFPYAFTLTQVYAGLRTAGTGASPCIVDIHLNGTTIMTTTKIVFTNGTKLSANGTLTTTVIAAGDYLEFFLDQRDTDNVATGLKVYIVGYH